MLLCHVTNGGGKMFHAPWDHVMKGGHMGVWNS